MIAALRILLCVVWSIFWISLSVICYLVTWKSSVPVAMARSWWSPGILWFCGIRLSRKGQVKADKDSHIYVSNHQSYLDIPMLFRAIPQNLYFVAKKELRNIPFLGWYMVMTGMIFIDRTNRQKSIQSLNRAANLIHQGKSVLMFPEGTRSSDLGIGSFKKGPFKLAKQADVSVIPVGIRTQGPSFSLNRLSKTVMEIHIGSPEPINSSTLEEFMNRVQEDVSKLANKPILKTVV